MQQHRVTYAQLKFIIERLILMPPERRAEVLDCLFEQHSKFNGDRPPPGDWPSSIAPGYTYYQN